MMKAGANRNEKEIRLALGGHLEKYTYAQLRTRIDYETKLAAKSSKLLC